MHKKWLWSSLPVLLLFMSWPCFALSSVDSLYQKANTLFQQNQYSQAISIYEELIYEENVHSADLYYNLGNAYLKQERVGPAILYLEKARNIKPLQPDYRTNLLLARNLQEDDFGVIDDFFLKRWIQQLAQVLRSTQWAVVSVLFLFLACGSLLYWLFSHQYRVKRIAFWIGISFFILTSLSFLLGGIRQKLETNNPFAVIMNTESVLHIAPDNTSREIVSIHEGLKVRILDTLGDWTKIELSNKEVGWIVTKDLTRI